MDKEEYKVINENKNTVESSKIIGRKYKLVEKIGQGSFGEVFKGIDITNNELVAVKIDLVKSKVLVNEAKILKHLSALSSVPKLKWYGSFHEHKYIVLQLLGKSLLDIKKIKDIDKELTKSIFKQIVNIMADVHSRGIIYRDIKPENFLFDLDSIEKVYIIDFGLCKTYLNKDNQHITIDKGGHFTGTIRYLSIFIHNGYNHSRRDDLISVGYMMMYLLYNKLPWVGLTEKNNKKRYNQIKKLKIESLDDDENIFNNYMKICYKLKFDEKPNYKVLIDLIENL